MLQFLLADPEPLMHGNEIVHLDGRPVGYIQVGAYGHTLGAAVGIGFVEIDEPLTRERLVSGNWTISIAGRTVAAKASLEPLLDPKLERVKS